MKLAGVVSIGSYTAEDLARKQQSLKAVLHPDTQLDMFAADSGVPYIESSYEFYLSEAAVAPSPSLLPMPGGATFCVLDLKDRIRR